MLDVLLVNDDPDFLKTLAEGLRMQAKELQIITTDSGESALVILKTIAVDVVVTDLTMSDRVDGCCALEELLQAHPHLPVIVLSANSQTSIDSRLKGLQYAVFLEGPVGISEIARAILEHGRSSVDEGNAWRTEPETADETPEQTVFCRATTRLLKKVPGGATFQVQREAVSETATELDDIIKTLSDLDRQSRNLLEDQQLTLEDTRRLSQYVAEVRVLLAELTQAEARWYRGVPLPPALGKLKGIYRELEGMVKEERNSLDRKNSGILKNTPLFHKNE